MTEALLLVDIQNDFMPDGSLPVPKGDQIVPIVNRLQPAFDLVVASQDWHPADHASFASNHEGREPGEAIEVDGLEQILWPDHCVQNSEGAEFHPELSTDRIDKVIKKGTDTRIDSYSAFYDNGHRKATGLGDYLEDKGVDTVYITGLAADVCVKYTALDARKLGLTTYLVTDATYGVDLNEGDVDKAMEEMRDAGVEFTNSDKVLAEEHS